MRVDPQNGGVSAAGIWARANELTMKVADYVIQRSLSMASIVFVVYGAANGSHRRIHAHE